MDTLPRFDRTSTAASDDMALARRVAAGERAAFELLMRRHNRRLYRLVRAQMRALLDRKLDALPKDLRLVFVLRSVEELSVEETADTLGIEHATVRSRHFRARSLLRDALAQDIDIAERDLFDFGGEAKWTDGLRLHEVIAAAVDPTTALSVGLKVDADALPQSLKDGIAAGTVDLKSPATTLALLQLDAVVGLKGHVETDQGVARLTRVGVTCALCHSTVDDSFAPGIGRRLDGWPNRDLNVGAIIALSPAVDAAGKALLNGWGPGKYDPRHNIDGLDKPVVIPPAYGLAHIHRITVTGDGRQIGYWNRYVAVTQMGGLGSFSDPRLPLSVTNGSVDLVSDKLPALQAYQLSLAAPAPPTGSFDAEAAQRGRQVFEGKGQCAGCHAGPRFTDANVRLHPPADSVVEPETPSYAARSATKRYRTSPLRGLWQHAPYFHDGSAATLEDVARVYNARRSLGLTAQEIADLAQYLKSL